jgi:two-component system sensor histidine kinase AlgZ
MRLAPPGPGLWLAGRIERAEAWTLRAVVYLGVPFLLALIFDEVHSPLAFGRAFAGAFLVGAAISIAGESLYRLWWPAVVRRPIASPARLAAHVLTAAVAVGVGGTVAARLGSALFGWQHPLPRLWLQGGAVASVLVPLLVVGDHVRAHARELERREAAHRVAVLRAELAALQARTDPHFLFNALNTVAALIPVDPARAESLVERLSSVFHYTLQAGRRSGVALGDELDAVGAYLEIEALRLGPRLVWRFERDDDVDAVRVPPLVLQPLVENAVRHGAGGRKGATEIKVSARRRGAELVLAVDDRAADGEEAPCAVGGGAGVALEDLRARLALAYEGRARLDAKVMAPEGFRAEVVLPIAPPASPRGAEASS